MKRPGLLLLIFFLMIRHYALAQTASIPDPAFLDFLKTKYPSVINASDKLIIAQAATVTGTLDCSNRNIYNLEGAQYFVNIKTLRASHNNLTKLPDISALTKLETLDIQYNQLVTLPSLNTMPAMDKIFASNNQLVELPLLTYNTKLVQLIVFSNQLAELPPLNHLTKLAKIDAGNNKLKKLPDMSALVNMEQLLVWSNHLDSVPDLSKFPKLWRFNAGTNLLKYTPDFSHNPRMKILYLNSNQLSSLPDIAGLDSLDDVRLQGNFFDFAALSPVNAYTGQDTIFDYTPQSDFPGGTFNLLTNDSLIIPSGINSSGPATYQWYRNGKLVATSATPVLKIYPAVAGDYYVVAQSPAFPELTLKTSIFKVSTTNCLDLSGLQFDINPIRCLQAGELWINGVSLPTDQYIFQLTGVATNKVYTSVSGKFKDLSEPSYSLTVSNAGCTVTYTNVITVPMLPCKETYITPDGDGDMDTYFFDRSGKVAIYDKQGRKVKQLNLPSEWDGTDTNGKRVPQGYYVCTVNEGEDQVNITVIY